MRNTHIFLLSHLRNIRNLEYIWIFIIFETALFGNNDLSERFQVHDDSLINRTYSYHFPQHPKYSLSQCCHYSRYDILRCMWSTYRTSANTLYEKYPPHTSNAQILDGKSLILFRTKGNITWYSSNHLNIHCTRHNIDYKPDYKIQVLECHQPFTRPLCK
jgi:hypothetical protein